MVPPILHDALVDYRGRLLRELPGRVERVVLFGSWARGEAHEDSDVDVLVLIKGATSAERLWAVEIGAEVGFDHQILIEPVVLSSQQWDELERRERAFVIDVTRAGAEVHA